MNEQVIQLLRDVITKWRGERQFTFENKQIRNYISPIAKDEFVLTFSNSVSTFFCNGKLIPIELISRPFHTNTINDNPISQNPTGDKYRLEKFLQEFDEEFYKEVENKLSDCIETLTTSDPVFF